MVSRRCYRRVCTGRLRTQYKKDGMPYKICSNCDYRSDNDEEESAT